MKSSGRITVYTTRDLAQRAGWPTQKMRRWLKKYNAVSQGPTGRYVTTPEMLANDAEVFWQQMVSWGERTL